MSDHVPIPPRETNDADNYRGPPIIIARGTLVQFNPATVQNPMFAGCIMVVTEGVAWGAIGYVQALGENSKPGGQAYYRATATEYEIVGHAAWMVE